MLCSTFRVTSTLLPSVKSTPSSYPQLSFYHLFKTLKSVINFEIFLFAAKIRPNIMQPERKIL